MCRTAELTTWDETGLAETLRSLPEDFDLDAVGFTADEVDTLVEGLGDDLAGEDGPGDAPEELPVEKWMIVVECRDERQQVELLGRFKDEGLERKAIVA